MIFDLLWGLMCGAISMMIVIALYYLYVVVRFAVIKKVKLAVFEECYKRARRDGKYGRINFTEWDQLGSVLAMYMQHTKWTFRQFTGKKRGEILNER